MTLTQTLTLTLTQNPDPDPDPNPDPNPNPNSNPNPRPNPNPNPNCSGAIKKAIATAILTTLPTVYFPADKTYLTRPFNLSSGMTLLVDGTIRGVVGNNTGKNESTYFFG